jgi:cytosine/adenosine deaminase-related metal-dependent hydrolase
MTSGGSHPGTLLVRNAEVLVTMDQERRENRGGGLFAGGNLITVVGPLSELPQTADRVIDPWVGGARVIGRDDIGALAPGTAADFAAFDPRTAAMACSSKGPVAAPVFCSPGWASWVVINGRVVGNGGRLATVELRSVVERHYRLSIEPAA